MNNQSKFRSYFQPFGNNDNGPLQYMLTVKQQPQKARMCSFRDKVDRRPIDPPPIVQIHQSNTMSFNDYQNSANFFVHATLVDSVNHSDLHYINGNTTISGSVVQSLHKLKDTNNTEGAFFIFSDLSIRMEGVFKLKFTLFLIKGMYVETKGSVLSDSFRVYTPKSFPGMSESTELTRFFSDQGVRIRVRKETRINSSSSPSMKRRRHNNNDYTSSLSSSPKEEEARFNVMSMQNLLSSSPIASHSTLSEQQASYSNRSSLLLPLPTSSSLDSHYYYKSATPPPLPSSTIPPSPINTPSFLEAYEQQQHYDYNLSTSQSYHHPGSH